MKSFQSAFGLVFLSKRMSLHLPTLTIEISDQPWPSNFLIKFEICNKDVLAAILNALL